MAIQFILGRSGTGKTRFCIDQIINELLNGDPDKNLIFLVPEQATYQAERAILSDGRIKGYGRLHVLSFDRLGYLLSGKRTARPNLSRVGKQMLIGRILRENRDKLKIFGSVANRVGVAEKLAETVEEFLDNGYGHQEIREILKIEDFDGSRETKGKLEDIEFITGEYLNSVESKFADPVLHLKNSAELIRDSEIFEEASLWVDGFSGFSGNEFSILRELFKRCEESKVALCLDADDIDLATGAKDKLETVSVFYPTEKTYAGLLRVRKEEKLELIEPIILKEQKRFKENQVLSHLEKNIFKFGGVQKLKVHDEVNLLTAGNVRNEVRAAAREIDRIVREGDIRYRDIAVVVTDMNLYEHYVRAAFEDAGVPYFIDKQKSLSQHSAAELLTTALKVVREGFSTSDVLSYVKTGFTDVSEEEIDLLENYCVAFGIEDEDWEKGRKWDYEGVKPKFDEDEINRIKDSAVEELRDLKEDFKERVDSDGKVDVSEFTKTVFEFLGGLDLKGKLATKVKEAVEDERIREAEEHRQFFDKFVSIFDELYEIFGDSKLEIYDIMMILRSAFSDLKMAFIPPTLDQVLVGTIDRSRHPDLKVVFMLGATQKQFPSSAESAGLLNERDRETAEEMGFELLSSRRERLSERQYLGYIAFTRASDRLYVSYPAADEKGTVQSRSSFISELEGLYDGLEERALPAECENLHCVSNVNDFEYLLCRGLGRASDGTPEKSEILKGLLEFSQKDKSLSGIGKRVNYSINYKNSADLSRDVLKKLYAGELKSSASSLGVFAKCPFQYFASKVLNLEPRQEFEMKPMDKGTFFHEVLERLVKKHKNKLAELDEEELLGSVDEQIEEYVKEENYFDNFRKHSMHNRYIFESEVEKLKLFVLEMIKIIRTGRFRPWVAELSFGFDDKSELGYLKFDLSGGKKLTLRGFIDRLDEAEYKGEKLGAVFDYKSSDKSFEVSDVMNGTDLQLPIYILAVKENLKKVGDIEKMIGAFFVPMKMTPGSEDMSDYPERVNNKFKIKGCFDGEYYECLDSEVESGRSEYYGFGFKDGKPYGWYNNSSSYRPEDFEAVINYSKRKIVDLGDRIVSGDIRVWPFRIKNNSACSYCDFNALCRFDWQINDYNFLEVYKKSDGIDKMREEMG